MDYLYLFIIGKRAETQSRPTTLRPCCKPSGKQCSPN